MRLIDLAGDKSWLCQIPSSESRVLDRKGVSRG